MRSVLAVVLVGYGQAALGSPTAVAPTAPTAPTAPATTPTVELVDTAAWKSCQALPGGELEGGVTCDEQSLEGGVPLRYRRFPAIARDGSVLAVVEERDGWNHVRPGIRFIDASGRSVRWLPLDGTGEAVRNAVTRANAELAKRDWVVLTRPPTHDEHLADDLIETTISFDKLTAVYRRRSNGNWWLPPSSIRVLDPRGRIVVERSDTERTWAAQPRCNLPSFRFVGASASPGALLFTTGLGMGDHRCDGVEQPPMWHVLAFP
jgi:hypothetical protein